MKRALLLAALAAPLGSCGAGDGAGERPTRVVLVTLDTLRLDSFENRMPRTSAWAAKGLVFERHYAATSTTQPTHASIFTGLHPWEHGVTANGMPLAQEHESVVERMQAAGWSTAAVVASFTLHRDWSGFGRGFDHYANEFGAGANGVEIDVKRDGTLHSLADRINERAFELLERLEGERQFLWVHYYDAHSPYGDTISIDEVSTPTFIQRSLREKTAPPRPLFDAARRLYNKDVRFLDKHLDLLLQRLHADEGVETHVVVVADHGESFGEGGAIGHGLRLTREMIHVPLFVLSPRVRPGTNDEPVGSVDVAATLLSLAELDGWPGSSRDLTGALESGPVLGMRRTFEGPQDEVRADGNLHPLPRFQLFLVEGAGMLTGDGRGLLRDDLPGQAVGDPEGARIRSEFERIEGILASQESGLVDDPAVLEALEALGYVH